MNKTFYVTFGQYHPLSEGWIEIQAASFTEADRVVKALFGVRYGSMYDTPRSREFYPAGKFGKTVIAEDQ